MTFSESNSACNFNNDFLSGLEAEPKCKAINGEATNQIR